MGRAIARAWRFMFGWMPAWLQLVVAAAILVGFFVWLARAARIRIARKARRDKSIAAVLGDDDQRSLTGDELEALAVQAEGAGDFAFAVRYRFRAGIWRLQYDVHALDTKPGVTTHQASQQLQSQDFNELARTFELVTYAEVEGQQADVTQARTKWPNVIEVARRDS